jgi:biotin carboxyl carrier protein
LEPELEKTKKEIPGLAKDLEDTLICALYPVTGKRFLRWKYGHEEPPPEVKPRTLQDAKAEEELIKKAKAGVLAEKKGKKAFPEGKNYRVFNVFVDDEFFEVGIEEAEGLPTIRSVQSLQDQQPTAPAQSKPVGGAVPDRAKPAAHAAVAGTTLKAPMPGLIISFEKKLGDTVKEGDTVVILEAMKMENALAAPVNGTIKAVYFSSGDSISKDDVICVIE